MPRFSLDTRRATALFALLFLALPSLSARASSVAEQEPNNACPGQPIVCGDIVDPAAINAPSDVDWYKFDAIEGNAITIETTDGDGGCGVQDTKLFLYASNCTSQLAMDDDTGQGFYSRISGFIAPYTGSYAIEVTAYSDQGYGCYRLLLGCGLPASAEGNDVAPLEAAVAPNPTAGGCLISFRTPMAGPLAVRIIDVQGREVWRSDGWAGGIGYRSFAWNGRGADGRLVSTGVYLARVTCGNRATTQRIVIAR